MHVLQSGQGQVLLLAQRRDLQDQQPPGERVLACQERPSQRPATELGQEPEVSQVLVDLGKIDRLPFDQQPLAFDEQPELGTPPREAADEFGRDRRLTPLEAETCFLVDDSDRVVIGESRKAGEELLGPRARPRSMAAAISTICPSTKALKVDSRRSVPTLAADGPSTLSPLESSRVVAMELPRLSERVLRPGRIAHSRRSGGARGSPGCGGRCPDASPFREAISLQGPSLQFQLEQLVVAWGTQGENPVPELVPLCNLTGAGQVANDRAGGRVVPQGRFMVQGVFVLAAVVEEPVPRQPDEECLKVRAVREVPVRAFEHPPEHRPRPIARRPWNRI